MPDITDFDGRCVTLTGAAGNLGRALAGAFAARGARLALIDLKREALEKAFGAESDARLLAPANLLAQGDVDAAVRAVLARFGRIDVLVNVAGGFRMGEAVHETSDRTLDFLFDLNVRSLVHAANAVVPHMLAAGGGKVVNIGAFAAQRGAAQTGAYAAAKSAVIRLTEAMAAELREKNINVNCVQIGRAHV